MRIPVRSRRPRRVSPRSPRNSIRSRTEPPRSRSPWTPGRNRGHNESIRLSEAATDNRSRSAGPTRPPAVPTAAGRAPTDITRPTAGDRAGGCDESGRRTGPPDGLRGRPRPADRPITAVTAVGPRSIRLCSASLEHPSSPQEIEVRMAWPKDLGMECSGRESGRCPRRSLGSGSAAGKRSMTESPNRFSAIIFKHNIL